MGWLGLYILKGKMSIQPKNNSIYSANLVKNKKEQIGSQVTFHLLHSELTQQIYHKPQHFYSPGNNFFLVRC